jgi:hypothetical protein
MAEQMKTAGEKITLLSENEKKVKREWEKQPLSEGEWTKKKIEIL